jgi:ribosomal protein L14E/L6E/L27E
MLLQEGRVCVKRYGRDAGNRAIITAILDDGFVKIITATRNKKDRKCNPKHLECLNEIVDLSNKEQINKVLGIIEHSK